MTAAILTPFRRLLEEMDGWSLPGAACTGRWELFDPPTRGEPPATTRHRHTQALALCHTCPALDRCRDWLDQLPPNQKPAGVVAGTTIKETTK